MGLWSLAAFPADPCRKSSIKHNNANAVRLAWDAIQAGNRHHAPRRPPPHLVCQSNRRAVSTLTWPQSLNRAPSHHSGDQSTVRWCTCIALCSSLESVLPARSRRQAALRMRGREIQGDEAREQCRAAVQIQQRGWTCGLEASGETASMGQWFEDTRGCGGRTVHSISLPSFLWGRELEWEAVDKLHVCFALHRREEVLHTISADNVWDSS